MKLLPVVEEGLYFFPVDKLVRQAYNGLAVAASCLHQENGNSSLTHLSSFGCPTVSIQFVFHCTIFFTMNR